MKMFDKLPDHMTIGELYNPAMEITDLEVAKVYLEALVDRCMRVSGKSREEATAIELSNIGYFAGYFDNEIRERVYDLYGAVHPIFGRTTPTPEEAFEAGLKMGRSIKGSPE